MFQSSILNRVIRGLDPIHTKTVELRSGQLFQGNITKIYPGQLAQLRLGSLTVTAKLEASLEKGKSYWFQVLGGDGIPRLKVIENLPSLNVNNYQGDNKGSQAILQQMNLPASSLNKQIVEHFVQGNLPFSKENISRSNLVLQQSSLSSDDGISLVTHMIKAGIPITKDTFNSMASLFSKQTIGEAISILQQGLEKNDTNGNYNILINTLKGITHTKVNMDHSQPPLINETVSKWEGITLGQSEPVIKQLMQVIGLQHEFDVRQQIQHAQAGGLERMETLKAQLLSFLQQNPSEEVSQLKDQANFLLNRTTAMQLMSSDVQQPFQQIVLQFPISLSGSYRDVTVQWEGKQLQNGKIDENHCRILFYLELENLEETIIDVQIQNRIISLTIFNNHDKPTELIQTWQPVLKEQLTAMNYQLSSLKWTKAQDQNKSLTISKIPTREDRGYKGVDVRI